MATIRNLSYQNSIVEQPIYDNVPLTRWIHDGIVVWENGGLPLYFDGFNGTKIICINASDKTIKSVSLPSYCNNPRIDLNNLRGLGLILYRNYVYDDTRDLKWFTQDFESSLDANSGQVAQAYSDLITYGMKYTGFKDTETAFTNSPNTDRFEYKLNIDVTYDTYPFNVIVTRETLSDVLLDSMRVNEWTLRQSSEYVSHQWSGSYFKDLNGNYDIWSAIPEIKIGHTYLPYIIKISSSGMLTLSDYETVIGSISVPMLRNTDNAYFVNDKFIFKVRSGNSYYIYIIDKDFRTVSFNSVSKKVYYSYPIAFHKGFIYLAGYGGYPATDKNYFLVTSDFNYFAEYKYSEITRTIPLVNPSTGEKIDNLTVNLSQVSGYSLERSRVAIDNVTTGLICYYGQNNEYLIYFEDYMFGSPNNFAVRVADIS